MIAAPGMATPDATCPDKSQRMQPIASYETISGERRRAIRHIARLRKDKNRLLGIVTAATPILEALTGTEFFAMMSQESQVSLTELLNASRDVVLSMEPEEEFEPE